MDTYAEGLLTAVLVGTFLEVSIFTVFIIAYSVGAYRLLQSGQSRTLRRRNLSLFAANTCMLALAVTHLEITLRHVVYGFIVVGETREDIFSYIFTVNPGFNLSQYYLYVTQTLIGDGFMRLYIVAQGKWRIITVPSILFVLDVVCGYMDAASVISQMAFFSISFITNTLCTIMIMTCLCRVQGSLVQSHWSNTSRAMFNLSRYRRLIEAVIESAAIYSLASISLLGTFVASPDIGYLVCMCAFPPLIGVVFALIVIQIADNSASRHPPDSVTHSDATASAARNVSAIPDVEMQPDIRKDAELPRTVGVALLANRSSDEEILAI